MPDAITLNVRVPDFIKEMKGFSERTQKRYVQRALAAGNRVFIRLAKQNARTLQGAQKGRVRGALRRNIVQIKSKYAPPRTVIYNVGVRTLKQLRRATHVKKLAFRRAGDPFYWYFLEHGWMPRAPGKKLRGGNRSRDLQRSRLRAGGARQYQYPFLTPAFAGGKALAVKAFNAEMEKNIAKENNRVR